MPNKLSLSEAYNIGGKAFRQNRLITVADSLQIIDEDIPAAKSGTLTVRTDTNTGSLTMAAGHGITTGQRLDLYWSGGSRRGIVVGTVATNVVPIDLGSGDDLPAAATVITAMVPVEKALIFSGDDLNLVVVGCESPSTFVFADVADAELHYRVLNVIAEKQDCWSWYAGNGYTNPLAGDANTKVFLSHGDATDTVNVGVATGRP